MKKLALMLCGFMLLLSIFTPFVHAAQPASKVSMLYIDGQPTDYISKVIDNQKISLISLRTASSSLKLSLAWAANAKEWTVANAKHKIVLKANSKAVQVDGKKKTMPVPVQIINGVSYISLRFIIEASGGRIAEFTSFLPTVGSSILDRPAPTYWASSAHKQELMDFIMNDDVKGLERSLQDWRELTIPDSMFEICPYVFVSSTQMVQVLLNAGFPIDFMQTSYKEPLLNYGYTLLHGAAYNGNYDLVTYLLEHNANANLLTSTNENVIDLATQGKKELENDKSLPEDFDLDTALANYDRTIELLQNLADNQQDDQISG
ncbi:stalk domain-containing protein [Paenibacillus sp. OV219]|uniref:stalk domain-containing protein n=1 Tax=Paenibacillus sp. OV219 TaxID=1884377 RepID=UPI0008D42B51|nr:stalk domain-containing protein [Paenibacillus sp. OV219]SEO12663.1 Ankyrin repeat-containing protein [Paenibacillus sp. OV219]